MSQLLLSDLTALANESRRRSPEVKTAADAALASLRADFDGTLAKCRRDPRRSAASDVYGREASFDAGATQILEEHLLLRPIVLACNAKAHLKVAGLGVSLLQRIIAMRVVPEPAIAPIVELLSPLSAKGDVELLLKLLQTFSALLLAYPSIHGSLLSSVLHLCFRLQDSKVQVVSSTAAATVRQTVMVVFEKVAEEDRVLDGIKEGGEDAAVAAPLAVQTVEIPAAETVTLFPSSADAYSVLSDLNGLAQDEPAKFLQLSSLPRTFTLELIESILVNHASLVRSHPELLLTLRRSTCPMLIRALSEKLSFPVTLRFTRLLFALLRQFSSELVVEVEILVSILLRFMSSDPKHPTPKWQRIIALEVTRSLCSEGVFLRNLWTWFDGKDSSARVFTTLVQTLKAVITEAPEAIGADPASDAYGSPPSSARASTDRRQSSTFGLYEAAAGMANAVLSSTGSADVSQNATLGLASAPGIQFVDQLEKAEPPPSSPTYVYLLASQSLVHLAQSLAQSVLPAYSSFVNSRPRRAGVAPPRLEIGSLSSETQQAEVVTAQAMVTVAAKPMRTAFFLLLSARTDDAIFCEVLTAVRNLTNTCGVLGVDKARDGFMNSLINLAAPTAILIASEEGSDDSKTVLSERNLAALRVLAHVTVYLSGLLDEHWLPVLTGICEAEYLLRRAIAKRAASARRDSSAMSRESSVVTSPSKHSVAPSTFQPGFSLASLPLDSKTGKLQLLSGLDYEAMLKEVGRCFDNSLALDTAAFQAFGEALCTLVDAFCKATADGDAGTVASPGSNKAPLLLRMSKGGNAAVTAASVVLDNARTVARLNMKRMALSPANQGWDRLTQQLLSISADPSIRAALRVQAAEVLAEMLYEAMGIQATTKDSSGSSQSTSEAVRIQRQIFTPLHSLSVLGGSTALSDVDVRKAGTETMRKIIETYGHALRLGWETIFEVAIAACDGSQAAPGSKIDERPSLPGRPAAQSLVKSAFASVQIVCSDLLSALNLSQIELSIQALQRFAVSDDINVALTAGSALWGITAELASRSPTDGTSSDQDITQLWLALLFAFCEIAKDARPEVRDAAVSGLFRVLASHGSVLSPEAWSRTLREVLFPLLEHSTSSALRARQNEQTAADAQPPKTPVSAARNRRTSSSMSNTLPPPAVAKQWEETCVVAFQQLGGVLGDFLQTRILSAPDAGELWGELLAKVKAAFLTGPASISQSSMRAFEAMLKSQAEKGEQSASDAAMAAWRTAWQTWKDIGDVLHDSATVFSQANLLAYIETFRPLYKLQSEPVELEAIPRLHLATTYSASPHTLNDVDDRTPVQTASREALFDLKEVPELPSKLLTHFADCISLPFSVPEQADGDPRAKQSSYIALHKSAVQDALELYSKWDTTADIYASGALNSLLAALLIPIKLRYDCPPPSRRVVEDGAAAPRALWQEATLAVCRITERCCRYLQSELVQLEEGHVQDLWRHLLATYQAALEADCSHLTELDAADPHRLDDQAYDLLLLSTFEVNIWPILGDRKTPSALIEQFATVLARASRLYDDSAVQRGPPPASQAWSAKAIAGADDVSPSLKGGTVLELPPSPRELFSFACLDLMFLICSDRGAASKSEDQEAKQRYHRVAALSLPYLLRRAAAAVQAYTADGLLQGGAPFPRIREEEMYVILTHLLDLRLIPSTLAAATASDPSAAVSALYSSSSEQGEGRGEELTLKTLSQRSPRAHLFTLHAQLCSILSLPGELSSFRVGTSSVGTTLVAPPELERSIPRAPAGFEYGGLIGREANVLGSVRLERDQPMKAVELARACLAVVSGAF
ncbi:hypothetical protein BCV69DRAFT_80150 [Microstroma glucosiphilum]|uniref:Protein MON2 homolog n=1 Tax=Pseudomicrostroma glucosiphilum TaxID=1684307 RepID=A0A316TYP8_9BASI|nr:hypothetical protein BCV69DRAFT_80150 [Pseudomicrostroma glucosiphilum]PWN18267.1 hypothetical protein BCV69DRAFT_80150 [Pseudomicrostroma glucosiphilum]